MSDECGLLSSEERALLLGEDGSEAEREELCESVRDRLRGTLVDFGLLYLGLRDEDFDAVFDPDNEDGLHRIRAATQKALTLLVMGMERNDDAVEKRLEEALAYAAANRGEGVDVTLETTYEPMASAEHYLERAKAEELAGPSLIELEAQLYDDGVAPEIVAELFTAAGMELTTDEVQSERGVEGIRRIPQAVVTDIQVREVSDGPPTED